MIITAKLDPRSQALFSDLRTKYFPAERNIVPAHLTLFHNVPKSCRPELRLPSFPLAVKFGAPYFLGKGFAVEVFCPELLHWRRQVLQLPIDFTAQDRQKKRLHITIQNKVEPELAKSEFLNFRETWTEFDGSVVQFDFWDYLNGPWAALP